MFKNQLQELWQKRQWPLPVYTSTRDGPDHNPRFGASVTVNGLTFNSTELSRSYNEAHNKAAQIAIDTLTPALPPPQPPSGFDRSVSKLIPVHVKWQHGIHIPNVRTATTMLRITSSTCCMTPKTCSKATFQLANKV